MQNNRFLEGLRRVYARYDRLMEKQGFYIVLGVCVLVILLSALYTFQLRDQWEEPPVTADTGDAALAAGGSQGAQTLSDAKALVESRGAEQLTVPTQAPLLHRLLGPFDRQGLGRRRRGLRGRANRQVHGG